MNYEHNVHDSLHPAASKEAPESTTPPVDSSTSGIQLPQYLLKARAAINTLPRSFAELRQTEASRTGDHPPFTVLTEGKKTTVFLPSELNEETDKNLQFFSAILNICEIAGIEVNVTKRQLDVDFYNTIKANHDNVMGALFCLSRDEISPMDNVPTVNETGWNFCLWYAFSKACNEKDASDYLKIRRVTNLINTRGNVWASGGQASILTRLSTFLRLASQNCSAKVKDPKKFLKGEGYFLEKFCGKKPIGGLYTDAELALAQEFWETRIKKVKSLYKMIPSDLSKLSIGGLPTIIGEMNISNTPIIKNIEDAKNKRIPLLMTVRGKGRAQIKSIAKGGNLPEKLYECIGGDHVRTIGKVMWSPLFAASQTQFTDASIREAQSILRAKRTNTLTYTESIEASLQQGHRDSIGPIAEITSEIRQCAAVYLEVIEEHAGSSSWDALFASSE